MLRVDLFSKETNGFMQKATNHKTLASCYNLEHERMIKLFFPKMKIYGNYMQ